MRDREIEPLNLDVMADLTVEELEARLEMQILKLPEAEACVWDCDTKCGKECDTQAKEVAS